MKSHFDRFHCQRNTIDNFINKSILSCWLQLIGNHCCCLPKLFACFNLNVNLIQCLQSYFNTSIFFDIHLTNKVFLNIMYQENRMWFQPCPRYSNIYTVAMCFLNLHPSRQGQQVREYFLIQVQICQLSFPFQCTQIDFVRGQILHKPIWIIIQEPI